MATLRAPKYDAPRLSNETDRRPLFAESIAPSDSASMITLTNDDGDRTPRAQSPSRFSQISVATSTSRHQSIAAPEQASADERAQRKYRGFASEQAYLDALRAWADGKRFADPTETTLLGFYGTTTMDEYANRPPLPSLGLKKRWKERKASKQLEREQKQNERRATVA